MKHYIGSVFLTNLSDQVPLDNPFFGIEEELKGSQPTMKVFRGSNRQTGLDLPAIRGFAHRYAKTEILSAEIPQLLVEDATKGLSWINLSKDFRIAQIGA